MVFKPLSNDSNTKSTLIQFVTNKLIVFLYFNFPIEIQHLEALLLFTPNPTYLLSIFREAIAFGKGIIAKGIKVH